MLQQVWENCMLVSVYTSEGRHWSVRMIYSPLLAPMVRSLSACSLINPAASF